MILNMAFTMESRIEPMPRNETDDNSASLSNPALQNHKEEGLQILLLYGG
jgi:hypothetical protein